MAVMCWKVIQSSTVNAPLIDGLDTSGTPLMRGIDLSGTHPRPFRNVATIHQEQNIDTFGTHHAVKQPVNR
jgi:hypothetical protein